MVENVPDEVLQKDPFIFWELSIRNSFDFKELYIRIHEFMMDWDWVDLFSEGKDFESYFFRKTNLDNTINHIIWWRAKWHPRNNARKDITGYCHFDFYSVAMKKVEEMHKGKKEKMDSGELKIKFSLFLDVNKDRYGIRNKSDWDTHPILKHFKKRFWDRTNKPAVDRAEDDLILFSRLLYQTIHVYTGAQLASGQKDFVPEKGI